MGDNDRPGEKIMTDTTTTPKPAPTREASPPFRPRMLTETGRAHEWNRKVSYGPFGPDTGQICAETPY